MATNRLLILGNINTDIKSAAAAMLGFKLIPNMLFRWRPF